MTTQRQQDLDRFYELLGDLEGTVGSRRRLGAATGRHGWPDRGVYFFFEPGEHRESGGDRVVRVGTHGLKPASRSTLWKRLRQHRGTRAGGGNHRGSVSASTSARHSQRTQTPQTRRPGDVGVKLERQPSGPRPRTTMGVPRQRDHRRDVGAVDRRAR